MLGGYTMESPTFSSDAQYRPRLRPVEAHADSNGQQFTVTDPSQLSDAALNLSLPALHILALMDGQRTLRETFDHMIYVIDFWTGWMTGRPVAHDRTTLQYDRSIAAFAERHERYQTTFAEAARQAVVAQRLDDTFIDHYSVRQSVGATILQLLNHNAQHRGEIRHMLERLGVAELWDYDPQEWEHLTGRTPWRS